MKILRRNWLGVVIAGYAALVLGAGPGCRSSDRSGATPGTAAAPSAESGAADALAGSDAERARAAMRKSRPDEGAQRPAAPSGASSTRVVDQPRVGGVRR